ncbi:MAG TPA: YaiI/YqxD family protein [Dokdonella sp.]
MRIWVDADACPNVIKDILYRAAERTQTELVLVANQALTVPRSTLISSRTVAQDLDAADDAIVEWAVAGDLAVTADIPLAAKLVDKGVLAINPRGELYSAENIRQQLSMRNFMDELRGTGVQTGGPGAFNQRDRQAFANQLDRLLAQRSPTAGRST